MILFIHGYERQERTALFNQMFHHRKKIFIDQKKWSIDVTDGEYEIDEFDRDDTAYVCSVRPDGTLAGSARLINTAADHMAASTFQYMFPGLTIRSPTIWEGTRFAVPEDNRIQPNGVSRAACEVILGVCLFGLEFGASQMTAIYEAPMARIYRKCGLTHYVLARHRTEAHGSVHFGLWDISREHEAAIRKATCLPEVETLCVAAE